MSNFNFIQTSIEGLYVIEQKVFQDNRGYFMETYNHEEFKQAGLDMVFVQDNQSISRKGVLRGLHFQQIHPQGKLVRVIKGEVFDVAVDLRRSSKTFGKWFGINLNNKNRKQLYIPEGFAHGFIVLTNEAEFAYKCTDYYYQEDQRGIIWNDNCVGINWPMKSSDIPILSDKDIKLPTLKELELL